MSKQAPVNAGDLFTVPFPFVREEVELPPDDPEATGMAKVMTWRPGVEFVEVYDDTEAVADGMGAMLLTVESVHKPGRFPTRVFFTRQWRDPDGREFGRGGLRVMTLAAFRRRLRGYMHDFELRDVEVTA